VDASWGLVILIAAVMVFVVLPLFRQRALLAARERRLRALQRARGTVVITLIHRQEQIGLLGVPLVRFIDIDDSEAVLRAIRMTPDDTPIDLVLHTPGGLVLAAEQIAHAVRSHPAKVTVLVPHYAMSGGTMLALAADEIVMDPQAVLGPVDPQLGDMPAASILRVVASKDVEHIDDRFLVLADVAEKAQRQVRGFVTDLLDDRMAPEEAGKLADLLAGGYFTHDFPITVARARELGLPVDDRLPSEIHELMALFPQPARGRPTVTYLPLPMPTPGGGAPDAGGGT
jgi:ClpP class serine protease